MSTLFLLNILPLIRIGVMYVYIIQQEEFVPNRVVPSAYINSTRGRKDRWPVREYVVNTINL